MADIIQSMFGIDPHQIQQQHYAQDQQQAASMAQMSPYERANYGIGVGAAGLTRAGAGMMGMVDPAVEDAKQKQAIFQGSDLTTVEGLKAAADKFRAAGDYKTEFLLKQRIAETEKEQQALSSAKQAQELALRKQDFAETQAFDLKKMEIEARIQQAKDNAENAKLAAADRLAAIREGNQLKLQLAQMGMDAKKTAAETKAAGKVAMSKQAESKSAEYISKKFGEIENTMADSLGVQPNALSAALTTGKGSSEDKLDRAVGFIDNMIPALTQDKANILSHIERLKSLGQTGGLQELRAAGVSPGSVTEREWPKFQADLGNIDTSLGAKELLKQYVRIYQKILDTRLIVKDAIDNADDSPDTSTTKKVVKFGDLHK